MPALTFIMPLPTLRAEVPNLSRLVKTKNFSTLGVVSKLAKPFFYMRATSNGCTSKKVQFFGEPYGYLLCIPPLNSIFREVIMPVFRLRFFSRIRIRLFLSPDRPKIQTLSGKIRIHEKKRPNTGVKVEQNVIIHI